MTKSYVISGNGVRFADEHFRVPDHVEIHFYRARRRPPQIDRPRSILDRLMVEIGVFPDWISVPGDSVPVHHCWASLVERLSSGVFRRSSGALVLDLAPATMEKPVDLRYIVDTMARGREERLTVLHWLVRTGEAEGVASRTRAFLTPPRLHVADGSDSAESRRIPLSIGLDGHRDLAGRD